MQVTVRRRLTISVISLALLPGAALGQSGRAEAPEAVERTPQNMGGMAGNPHVEAIIEKAKSLGPWSEQARWIAEAHEAMWRRNGWTSEPDQYARRLATAIESSPPWRLDQRLETFVRMSSERYALDAGQQADLRARVTREAMGFIGRFAPTIIQNFELFVETRARGKPLDADTAAELVRIARPAFEAYLPDIERSMQEFEETLRPEQREIFTRDRAAFQKRVEFVKGRMDDWAAGRWEPEEWGMDKDPLRRATGSESPDQPAKPQARQPASITDRRPDPGAPGHETAWELYVRQFITRYNLDEAQQTTARAILADLQGRAAKYWEQHAEEYNALTRGPDSLTREQMNEHRNRLAALEAPINELFDELVRRLDRLPTIAQRRAAEKPAP